MDEQDERFQAREREDGGEDRPTIMEMEVTEPTLTWLEVEDPLQPVPIGENDRVLDSHFNDEYDVWEVLLVALPDGS